MGVGSSTQLDRKQSAWKAIMLYGDCLRKWIIKGLKAEGFDEQRLENASNLELATIVVDTLEASGQINAAEQGRFCLPRGSKNLVVDCDWPVIWEINNALREFDRATNPPLFDDKYWDLVMGWPQLAWHNAPSRVIFASGTAIGIMVKSEQSQPLIVFQGLDMGSAKVLAALRTLNKTLVLQYPLLSDQLRQRQAAHLPQAGEINNQVEACHLTF